MSSNVGHNLITWLLRQRARDFPSGHDYATQFRGATDYLRKHVHPQVEKGAAINDRQEGMFLNDHGPGHIDTVIARASDILNESGCRITPYEGYIFGMATHLHDTGNLFGRDKHEQSCREIMNRLGTRAGDDELEKKIITDIAAAHGGRAEDGSKDTLAQLLPQPKMRLLNQDVRVHLLAGLLRFADELADDRTRASRFAVNAGAVPDASELYHRYSQSLHSVTVSEREVKLDFDLSETVAKAKYLKTGQQVYLLDEIFARTIKMHLERMYCMRFLRPLVRLDEIRVNIEVFEVLDGRYGKCLEQIQYRLIEKGYPDGAGCSLRDLCPEIGDWTGEMLSTKLTQQNAGPE